MVDRDSVGGSAQTGEVPLTVDRGPPSHNWQATQCTFMLCSACVYHIHLAGDHVFIFWDFLAEVMEYAFIAKTVSGSPSK